MGVFNFIETIFFVSLGITFVLILLLVYHFKQRISAIEQKADTMLDIINNIVKEIYVLKNSQQMTNRFFTTTTMEGNPSPNESVPSARVQVPLSFTPTQKINVSDNDEDDDSESESESEDDDDQEDGEDDSDGSSENNDDVSNEPVSYEVLPNEVEPDEAALHEELPLEATPYEVAPLVEDDVVKVITVSLESIELADAIESVETINEEDQLDDLNPAPIHVEKIDSDEPENLDEVVGEQKESSKEVYRKMTLQSLKALVITKGLCSDPSKMKKQELLKLLESVDE